MEKRNISEKDGEHKQWYEYAKKQTLETLPEFLRHLLNDYTHDYGTICHALAAGSVATTWAMDRSPQGGITGFQAGAIMWEYMKNWNNVKPPAELIRYEDMLYPQYQGKFEKSISKETWDFLQEKAKTLIKDNYYKMFPKPSCYVAKMMPSMSERVWTHWNKIACGVVPFGYHIEGSE